MRLKKKQRIYKRKKTRKLKKQNILKKIIKLFLYSILFTGFIFLGYKLREKIINGKLFPVKFIEVQGNKIVSKEEILKRLKAGKSIFLYTSGRIKEYLDDIKWIDRINVVFDFPNKVILKIKEKYPICSFIRDGSIFVVTDSKNIIKTDRKFYPVFKNYNLIKKDLREKIVDFLISVKSKKEEWYKSINEVLWDKDEGLILKMPHFLVKWGNINKKDIVKKFSYLEEVMKDLARKNKFPEYIDLRLADIKEAIVKTIDKREGRKD